MLKAIQCDFCDCAMTVAKLMDQQQVACPECQSVMAIPPTGIDKNTIVGNRYQIRGQSEDNSQSTLYMAMDLEIEELVLLRVYSWEFSSSIGNPEDFLHTISSATSLAEPAHVRLIDHGVDDGIIFSVWPYEDMESLDAIVKRNGALSPGMAVSICKDLALSLDKAFHAAGVGHFNLTPSCIFVNSQGNVRYCDFGTSAHLSNDAQFMQSGFAFWNMKYLSPEMALGWSYPDFKSDMYGLASVLYYLVSGNEPHASVRNVQEINYDSLEFPVGLDNELGRVFQDFFYSMTARNPAQRYMSWSAAVSKMDEFLYEEKSKKSSGVSQRHRASLTKAHSQDELPGIKVDKTNKKKISKSNSQRRMSAEDVRAKFSNNEGAAPVSFAKNTPVPQMQKGAGSGGSRRSTVEPGRKAATSSHRKTSLNRKGGAAGVYKKSAGGNTRKGSRSRTLNGTGNSASVQGRKRGGATEEKSKSNGLLIFFGIGFALMVVVFVVMFALGRDKKSITADGKAQDGAEVAQPDKPEDLDGVDKPEDPVAVEPDKPVDPDPDGVDKPERLVPVNINDLLAKIKTDLKNRESDPIQIEEDIIKAERLSVDNGLAQAQLEKINADFAPRRLIAVRVALTDAVQEIRNLQLRKMFDEAVAKCDNYSGPFAKELASQLSDLKAKLIAHKNAPDRPVVLNIDPGGKVKPLPIDPEIENVSVDELAAKIAKAQTGIALKLLPEVIVRFGADLEQDLTPLKDILEKSDPITLQANISKQLESKVNEEVTLTVKGQKMTGTLLKVDNERKTLQLSVTFSGRSLVRVVKLSDIPIVTLFDMVQGGEATEASFLKMILQIREKDTIGALKSLVHYVGPLKLKIYKALLGQLDKEAIDVLLKIVSYAGLPKISDEAFIAALSKLKINKEDAWLTAYLLNRFKVNFVETDYVKKHAPQINAFSKILVRLIAGAKEPNIIVSPDAQEGTKSLENALREAKSGEVIRILPGLYTGSFDIRQRNIKLYGASGVFLDSTLRISSKGVLVKQLNFSNGDLEIINGVTSVDVVNCYFSKGGINMLGGNADININNCLFYGLNVKVTKRIDIENCTILERVSGNNKANSYAVNGYINGDFKNCVVFAPSNYVVKFAAKDKTNGVFRYCLIWGGNALAMMDQQRISDIKAFKKNVARVSSVIIDKAQFNNPSKGDYTLKDLSPGFLAGDGKKSMGVQMDARLNLIDVK